MKVAQISVLGRVYGNVNADEVIGQRITIKKMYSSEGEVYPFVSARAIKRSIREALREKGYEIDPYTLEARRLVDTGDPKRYIDNDLFGFMRAPRGGKEVAARRQGAVAISYFKALKDTPVKSELGLRSPRLEEDIKSMKKKERALLPFEIEVADFIGRLNCLIYEYLGKYTGTEGGKSSQPGKAFVSPKERRKRLEDFLDVFLTPKYVLPKRTNSLNVLEYYAALIALSDHPVPVYQYLDYLSEDGKIKVDIEKLNLMTSRKEMTDGTRLLVIDYTNAVPGLPSDCPIEIKPQKDVVEEIVNHLVPSSE